jgi:alpha-ketoglutarate-dependent taurine dioxygenase
MSDSGLHLENTMATFRPLRPRIGAEALVTREELLDPAFGEPCLAALERYGVLLFPQIHLTDEQQVEFSSHLGKVTPQGPMRADGTREVVFKITLDSKENASAEYLKSTIHWHIDGLFDETPPPKATLLSGRRLSPTGGQTEFCNVYAAYEDLSQEDHRRCDPLRILHSLEASNRVWNPDADEEERARWRARRKPKEHPLVWRHVSGRKSLVLGMTVDHVVGMPAAESKTLVERLTAHTTRPENVYRHEWRVGDLLIWDNCGVMHRALPYDPQSGRMMHRTVLDGVEAIA